MLRRTWACLALLAVLLLVLPAAAAGPPAPDTLGPYAVGHTLFHAHDEVRDRTLPVHVWYPVRRQDAAGVPAVYRVLVLRLESAVALENAPIAPHGLFPLVIFSHGNGGVATQSFFLTEVLASHGFVVASPDHVGNTMLDLLFGNVGDEEILQSALDRPRDVSFLIDTMLERSFDPADRFHLSVNPFRIGVAGHSFGGFTSLALAAGFDGDAAAEFGVALPEGFQAIPADPRVRAIVPIAPASSALSDRELRSIRVPTLLIGGSRDRTTPIDPELTRPFDAILGRPLYRADVLGAGHFSFTNVCDLIELALDAGLPPDLVEAAIEGAFEEGCSPSLLPVEEAQRLTNLLTVSFLRRHLSGDARYEHFLTPGRARAHEPDLELQRKNARPPHGRWLPRLPLLGAGG